MNCEMWARFYGWGFLKWEGHPWSITLICSFTQQVFKYTLSITVRVGRCCRWSRQNGKQKKKKIIYMRSILCMMLSCSGDWIQTLWWEEGTGFTLVSGSLISKLRFQQDQVPCPDPRWRYFQEHPRGDDSSQRNKCIGRKDKMNVKTLQ